jgi:hypothetical protein
VADERTCARSRDIDRHEIELREFRDKYVTEKVFEARVGPLERDKASRRNLLLGIAGTLIGVLASALITYMIARGGH